MDLISLSLITGGVILAKEGSSYLLNRLNMTAYRWNKTMANLKLDFKIIKNKQIKNGVELTVKSPAGKSYKDLEKHIDSLESSLRGIVTIEDIRFTDLIKIEVINKELKNYDFIPVKSPNNLIFIGKNFSEKNFFIDIEKDPHILIGGMTGTGKTFLLSSILTNLIYNNSNNIDLYISQIIKGEIGQFSNCKPVKFVGNTLEEVSIMLEKIAKKVDERCRKFNSRGYKNLSHYNKNNKNKLKRIYFAIEEVSFFIASDSDPDEIKQLKNKCWTNILTIVKAGRAAGVHFLSVTQRSTVANIPSEVKSQMCCITLRQRSKRDSENIIEDSGATKLKERECFIFSSQGLDMVKVPSIDEDYEILQKYVKEIIVPNKPQRKIIKLEVEEVKFTHTPIDLNKDKIIFLETATEKETKNEIKENRKNERKGRVKC